MTEAPDDPARLALLADRFAGALLGTAVGDALGAPFEGRRRVPPGLVDRLERDPGPLTYTDDTHMTIGVAESLLARGGFDGEHLARTFLRNFDAEPWRGYGPGPPAIFDRIRRGERWDEVAGTLFGGTGSFGNGGAMRVAPVALACHPDLDRTAALARDTARITHTHPEALDGAVCQAVAIGHLLGTDPDTEVDTARLLGDLGTRLTTDVFRRRLDEVLDALDHPDAVEAGRALGTGIEARNSVPTALYCFLRRPGSFPESVKLAIALGGDTDTIAAMTGGLAGGASGLSPYRNGGEGWREASGCSGYAERLFARHARDPFS